MNLTDFEEQMLVRPGNIDLTFITRYTTNYSMSVSMNLTNVA